MLGLGLGLPGAAVMRGGGEAPKTEADFNAHIAALPGTPMTWGATATDYSNNFLGRKGVATAAAAAGTMVGTSYLNLFRNNAASPCRVIQHGVPSQAIFDDLVARGAQIYVDAEFISLETALNSLNRNGYASAAYSGAEISAIRCNRLLYWYQGQAWQVSPVTSSTPTPYVF